MRQAIVPSFYLYGEPHRSVEHGFVHVESLDQRSRPGGWTIRPHAHAELAHVILIATGGGTIRAEDRQIAFTAPSLLLMPANVVHGFEWHPESTGWVTTLASGYLAELTRRDPSLAGLFARARAIPLQAGDADAIGARAAELARELGWAAPGHRAAVDSALLAMLVIALRRSESEAADIPGPGRNAALVARLRERIEQRFRLREPVSAYAAALGVSVTALRNACGKAGNPSPAAMLDQRALIEARRALLYSDFTIAEIGYAIGFEDPAYFSRFFARHVGCSPRHYREERGLR